MRNAIFREVSLERLSSPEQLDQLMQVTTTKGWAALSAFALLVIVGVVWAVVGTLPERVVGQGILVRSGGVFEVASPTSGRVTDMAVRVGEVVREGQIVARVGQEQLINGVDQARAVLASREAEQRQARTFGNADLVLQLKYLDQQRTNLQQSTAAAQQEVRALSERLRNESQLATQGLLTKQAQLATRQQVNQLTEQIRANGSALTEITLKEAQLRNETQEHADQNQFKVDEAKREVARLETQLRNASEIISPYTGRVLELMSEQGNVIGRGDAVLSVDLTGRTVKELEAIVYVSSTEGKKLKPGMVIQIAPSTVRTEEYGYMLGKVTYVSDFPATQRGMNRVLKNEQLVTALSGRDAPYEIHADLVPDADTRSGYRWSSSKGPATRVQSGTLARALITVNTRRPIGVVLPMVRRYAGG